MLGSCMFQARSQPLLDEVKHITLRKKINTAFFVLKPSRFRDLLISCHETTVGPK